jgi:glycosyltransferase involved in cell wall biosynthesis
MMDALEQTSDYTYVAAFGHGGAGTYKEVPVPQAAKSLFLEMIDETPLDKLGRSGQFRKLHKDWRADLYPLKYDMVIVAGYGRRTEREILRDCKKRGVPVAMFSDSNIRSQKGRGIKAKLKRCLKRKMLRQYIDGVDYMLTANSLGVAYWRYYGARREKIVLCPYYADYSRVDAARKTERAEVLGKFGLSASDKIIVTAARLVPVKGLHLMIAAFKELKLAAKGWKYVIAGTGPLEQELKAQAGEEAGKSILFVGFQQPSSLLALIHHSAMFAFPSVYEPHGIVVHESLAAETPVLSSDASGSAYDLVKNGVSGWKFKSGDQAALTRVLKMATDDETKLAAMRKTARATFEEWFERTNPVKVIDKLAHKILAGGK